jgi:3-oxoacyl-[acyl-carrier protein] reductase
MEELTGRVALVTGGGRGIGRAIALALAGGGANIAVNYRERAAAALEAVEEIRGTGRRAIAVQADVSRGEDVRRMAAEVERQLGPTEILVNNAGIARVQRAEEITEEDWDELLTTNLKSCFLVSQAVLPGMRARH